MTKRRQQASKAIRRIRQKARIAQSTRRNAAVNSNQPAASEATATKVNRCSSKLSRHSPPPHPIIPSSELPLSLAVYRPASLFAMLLMAALTKNTFSLRWLTQLGSFSHCTSHSCGRHHGLEYRGAGIIVLGVGRDLQDLNAAMERKDTEEGDEGTIGLSEATFNELLQSIPRGGAAAATPNTNSNAYSGLINLGNTCYLNAQLQCAYHVPRVRELVLRAKDRVVEIEVEVEEDDAKIEDDIDQSNTFDEQQAADEFDHMPDESETLIDAIDEESTTAAPAKNTIIKQEHHPISPALSALQHTFQSLSPTTSSSGTTQILCRSLGINPYIQQDGQEFWKLFVPELDYTQLSQLYTGYYDDYIREIIDENGGGWEEEKKEDMPMRENNFEPRERVRTDPFLDLSIPVTEGTGCSVETSLKETFVQPEILRVSEGNGWRPNKHDEKVDAYKGLSLRREGLPSLLQLHLKRFKYDWETGETSKINDRCTFPLELDLSEILVDGNSSNQSSSDCAIYDLQSVVIHRGEYGSGHYYSYVRPDINVNEWYRFDDQNVIPVDFSDVIADAYGGKARERRASFNNDRTERRRKGILRRIFSFGGFGSESGRGFGYGGRTSSAYMIQYVRRSDRAKLGY